MRLNYLMYVLKIQYEPTLIMETLNEQIAHAHHLRETNQLPAAETLYKSILEAHPNQLQAIMGLGQIYRQQDQSEQALAYFQQAVALNPNELWPQLFLSDQLRDKNEFATALLILNTIEQQYPNNGEIVLRRGYLARAQGEREQALSYFQQTLQLNPNHIWTKLAVIDELRWHKQFDQARELLNEFLITEPINIHFLLRNFFILRELGQREQALRELHQAIAIHPNDLRLRLELAVELREQNQLEASLTEFNFLQQHHPPNFYVVFHLAQLYRKQGNYTQALIYFNTAIKIDSSNIHGDIAIVEVLRESQQFTAAWEKLAAIEQIYPQRFETLYQKGLLYRAQNDNVQALSCFQQAYSLDNSNPHILLEIAKEQFKLGNINAAIETVVQNLKYRPTDLWTLLQLGDWLNIANAKEQALKFFQKALEFHPNQIHPYLRVAQLLYDFGRIDEALHTFEQAIKQCGERPEVYLNKSQMLWASRELDAAWHCLEQGLNLFSDNYWLQIRRIDFLIQQGQFGSAQKFINSCPADTLDKKIQLQTFSAQIAERQWQIDTAISINQEILKLKESYIPAHEALRRLFVLKLDIEQPKYHAMQIAQYRLGEQKINGQTMRGILHDHVSQIIEEYVLNFPVWKQAKQALNLVNSEQRLNELATLVQQEPQISAVVNAFLAELHQQQYLGYGIPKRIFQYWDSVTLPAAIAAFTQSWGIHNPDYSYQLFNEQTAREFLRINCEPKVLRAYSRARYAAQKADLLRLVLLNKYGGVYADADDRCLKPLAQWLPKEAKIVLFYEEYASVGNNFMACIAKHPIIQLALEYAVEALLKSHKDLVWLATGPAVVSRSLALYLAQHWQQTTPKDLGVVIIAREELMQHVGIHGQLPYKSTTDSWMVKEFQSGKKLDLMRILENLTPSATSTS